MKYIVVVEYLNPDIPPSVFGYSNIRMIKRAYRKLRGKRITIFKREASVKNTQWIDITSQIRDAVNAEI